MLAGVPQFPAEPEFVNVQPWPLDVGFDAMTDIGFGWRCASYEGEEAQALLGLFAGANQVTTWDDGGTEYSIKVRPLFPQQEPCTAGRVGGLNRHDCGPRLTGPQSSKLVAGFGC